MEPDLTDLVKYPLVIKGNSAPLYRNQIVPVRQAFRHEGTVKGTLKNGVFFSVPIDYARVNFVDPEKLRFVQLQQQGDDEHVFGIPFPVDGTTFEDRLEATYRKVQRATDRTTPHEPVYRVGRLHESKIELEQLGKEFAGIPFRDADKLLRFADLTEEKYHKEIQTALLAYEAEQEKLEKIVDQIQFSFHPQDPELTAALYVVIADSLKVVPAQRLFSKLYEEGKVVFCFGEFHDKPFYFGSFYVRPYTLHHRDKTQTEIEGLAEFCSLHVPSMFPLGSFNTDYLYGISVDLVLRGLQKEFSYPAIMWRDPKFPLRIALENRGFDRYTSTAPEIKKLPAAPLYVKELRHESQSVGAA